MLYRPVPPARWEPLLVAWGMTVAQPSIRRKEHLLYVLGIMLSTPSIISLAHRHFGIPVAPEIQLFIAGYRALADGLSAVVHAPLRGLSMPPSPPLIDLHILSFAGMGMMTKALEAPGERKDAWHATIWSLTAFVLAYLLVGILVMGAMLAALIANPVRVFRSDHWIETTPVLEGLRGRLRRERTYRLERDLARIMAITLGLVGAYFALNALLLNRL